MISYGGLVERMRDDERALLRAVVLDDLCSAADAWRSWRQTVDFDDIDPGSQRLIPQVARRLGVIAPDDPLRARIRGIYRFVWARNQSHVRDAARVARQLIEAGVPVLVLKGLALVSVYGDDWGARPMFDVDLLVPTERAATALRVLEGAGWESTYGMSADAISSRLLVRRHSWNYSHPQAGQIDLHWHVFAESLGARADRAVWAAAVSQRVLDVELRRPCNADLLLHLIEHGSRLEPASTLQWLADAHRLLASSDPRALAGRLKVRARAHGLIDTAVGALLALEEVVGTGVATPVLDALRSTRPRAIDRVAARTTVRASDSPTRKTIATWLEILRMQRDATGRPSPGAVLQRVAEPALARHRWLAPLYVASRRARRLEVLLQRLAGPLARPPASGPVPSGEWLDFTDPRVVDRVAGPGWSWTGPNGTWSDSPDARLLLPVEPLPGHDLAVSFDINHDEVRWNPNRFIEVRVNGRPLLGLDLDRWARHEGPRVVRVPEWLARWCHPLELSFRTPHAISPDTVRGDGDHRRLGLPITRLRVDLVDPNSPPDRDAALAQRPRRAPSRAAAPLATVVVVSRDRWSLAPRTLELLLARTDPRHPVVVVDGGAPRGVAAAFDRVAATERIRIIRRARFLASNEARNLGADGARTEWVAFVENDAVLSEGWLETLLEYGEALGAASVYPAYLEQGPNGPFVHGIGADLELSGPPGARRLRERPHHSGRLWEDVRAELEPVERVQAEPHALVIRRALLEQLGGLDESLLSWFDHTDLGLHQQRLSAPAWLVPSVTCMYLMPPPVPFGDRPAFSLRWGRDWFERSLRHLCAVWGLDPHDSEWDMHAEYRTFVRRAALTPWRRVNAVVDRATEPVDGLLAHRWHARRLRDLGQELIRT